MATETRISKVDMNKRAIQPVGVNNNNFVKMGELNLIIDQLNNVLDENVDHSTTAINATATATAAQIASGYITSTSAAAVAITLPTAVQLAAQISATAGTVHTFYVDNSAGSNTITVAVGTGITVGTAAVTGSDTLTVSVANVVGKFELVFTSATAAILRRVY